MGFVRPGVGAPGGKGSGMVKTYVLETRPQFLGRGSIGD